MNLLENIQLALAGLKAGKMRALLTMLGIIIGIGSVIAIVTVGNSLTVMFTTQMAAMGANNIEVSIDYVGNSEYVYFDVSDSIQDDMIEALESSFAGRIEATSVTESAGQGGQAREGRKYANTSLMGVSPGYKTANNVEMVTGRFIAARDHQKGRSVTVISDFVAGKIFGSADPLGKEIKIYTDYDVKAFTVVGVYKYEQNAMMGGRGLGSSDDISTQMYIPVSTALRITGSYSGYSWFMVVAATGEDIQRLCDDISEFFNTRYYASNDNWNISCFSMESMMEQVTSMLTGISFAIAFIAAISLLVGGIGVMNIMLVSVTERTREIGTRKALGARNSAIRIQFIVESIIICMIGGIIGISLGVGLGIAGSGLLEGLMLQTSGNMKAVVPFTAVLLAVGFSMVIGVFFGYYPASKAAKLDPIDALRYE